MAWSKCKVEIGDTGDKDAFATTLTQVGKTQDQSTELTSSDGDTLTEKASGGEVVAEEQNEGTLKLVTKIIEPSAEFLEELGIAEAEDGNGEQAIKTHIVSGDKSIKITPKNKGAKGIKIPTSSVSVAENYDEKDGNILTLTANVHKTTAVDPTYMKKGTDGWAATTEATDIAASKGLLSMTKDLPSDAATGDVYGIDENYWYKKFTTKTSL